MFYVLRCLLFCLLFAGTHSTAHAKPPIIAHTPPTEAVPCAMTRVAERAGVKMHEKKGLCWATFGKEETERYTKLWVVGTYYRWILFLAEQVDGTRVIGRIAVIPSCDETCTAATLAEMTMRARIDAKRIALKEARATSGEEEMFPIELLPRHRFRTPPFEDILSPLTGQTYGR